MKHTRQLITPVIFSSVLLLRFINKIEFLPGEVGQFRVKNDDGTMTEQTQLTHRVLAGNLVTPHELMIDLAYPTEDGETLRLLEGWDADGDGEIDYRQRSLFTAEKSLTLTAIYKKEPLTFQTEIELPLQFEPEFPASAKPYLTNETKRRRFCSDLCI